MERYSFEVREGLDLYTPEDRHDAYRALDLKVIAYPDGAFELIGNSLPTVSSERVRSMPSDRSQVPLSTDSKRPFFTVTPPLESR
jgi:hypothetical protein